MQGYVQGMEICAAWAAWAAWAGGGPALVKGVPVGHLSIVQEWAHVFTSYWDPPGL